MIQAAHSVDCCSLSLLLLQIAEAARSTQRPQLQREPAGTGTEYRQPQPHARGTDPKAPVAAAGHHGDVRSSNHVPAPHGTQQPVSRVSSEALQSNARGLRANHCDHDIPLTRDRLWCCGRLPTGDSASRSRIPLLHHVGIARTRNTHATPSRPSARLAAAQLAGGRVANLSGGGDSPAPLNSATPH